VHGTHGNTGQQEEQQPAGKFCKPPLKEDVLFQQSSQINLPQTYTPLQRKDHLAYQ